MLYSLPIDDIQYSRKSYLDEWHVVKHGLDLGLDWTCKLWTGLVKHGLVKHGLVKHGLVKHGRVKHGLDFRGNLLSTICFLMHVHLI
jgi:hypothetical protein